MNKAQITTIIIGVFVSIMFMIVGIYFASINFEVDKNMCQTMKTSNYDFTHDIQVDASYSENCFDIMNHPLEKFYYQLGGAILGLLISIFVWLGILALNTTVFDYY